MIHFKTKEMRFKEIHIGNLIEALVKERNIDITRICNFFNKDEKEITAMFLEKSIDTEMLLKWSKLLEYDFFRMYTQHLILYSPSSYKKEEETLPKKSTLPQFRKNIYTEEIVHFVIDQINSGKMTKREVIETYRIPKTTLYKWLTKIPK